MPTIWQIIPSDTFNNWFDTLDDKPKENILASLLLLQRKGPHLQRPYADTVKASKISNMKELRVQSQGNPFRIFYAFDPDRNAIVLCGGNKKGNDKQFYRQMISLADKLYTDYLDNR